MTFERGAHISQIVLKIRESLFTIPVLIVVSCALAAVAALYIDANNADLLEDWLIVLGTTVPGGRAIATTVAGATITVAAIVFSITALSTQMAANQYSPRALGGFFEDTFQQAIIGLVVGTFTYSLLVLASLSNAVVDQSMATPSVTVTLDIVLGVASAVGIVAYINHSLKRMQIDSVVRRIAAAATQAISKHLQRPEGDVAVDGSPPEGEARSVSATSGGWVVDIDAEKLLEVMTPDSTARVDVRLGEAVSTGDRLIRLWSEGESGPSDKKLRSAITTASERSIELDPTFGIRQLVDIALRALSPGVNDPSTAVDVIHHLKTPVRMVLHSSAPRRVFSDRQGRRVFLAETPGRSDYVHDAFSEIRLAAGGQPPVLAALIEVLQDLESDLDGDELRGRETAVLEQLRLTVELVEQSDLPEIDRDRVLSRLAPRHRSAE